jgi:hypothetical protein
MPRAGVWQPPSPESWALLRELASRPPSWRRPVELGLKKGSPKTLRHLLRHGLLEARVPLVKVGPRLGTLYRISETGRTAVRRLSQRS